MDTLTMGTLKMIRRELHPRREAHKAMVFSKVHRADSKTPGWSSRRPSWRVTETEKDGFSFLHT